MKKNSFILVILICWFSNSILAQSTEYTSSKSKTNQDFLLKTYPNPAYDALLIEHDYHSDTPFLIYNIEGSVVQQGFLQEQFCIINIKSLPEGMYIFFVEGKTTRIVKVNPQ